MFASGTDEITARIIAFVLEVGISISYGELNDETFLPGIEVVDGSLVVDLAKLKFPGDALHEAGHLAVAPTDERSRLSGTVELKGVAPQVVELEAMLWSYAACVHLDLDPRIVFHADGYHGQSESLLRNFDLGVFPGIKGLEASGFTYSPEEAKRLGGKPFPRMRRWLR